MEDVVGDRGSGECVISLMLMLASSEASILGPPVLFPVVRILSRKYRFEFSVIHLGMIQPACSIAHVEKWMFDGGKR